MKKIMNKKIFTVILSIFILILVIPNIKVNASKNDAEYDLTISYGIDGGTRHMMLNTFNISLAFVLQTNERYKLKMQS